mmetsp:Transcript_2299/g.5807  ORF Transcript_2299/g.5807 Transcript_2299/m.5807 type:complete len:253 (-) Transcript_2299:1910-2668(-)
MARHSTLAWSAIAKESPAFNALAVRFSMKKLPGASGSASVKPLLAICTLGSGPIGSRQCVAEPLSEATTSTQVQSPKFASKFTLPSSSRALFNATMDCSLRKFWKPWMTSLSTQLLPCSVSPPGHGQISYASFIAQAGGGGGAPQAIGAHLDDAMQACCICGMGAPAAHSCCTRKRPMSLTTSSLKLVSCTALGCSSRLGLFNMLPTCSLAFRLRKTYPNSSPSFTFDEKMFFHIWKGNFVVPPLSCSASSS